MSDMTAPESTTEEPQGRDVFSAAIDNLINLLFELTHSAGVVRMQLLALAVAATWFILAMFTYTFTEWRLALVALVNPGFVPEIQQPFTNIVFMVVRAFFSFGTLGHLLALGLPFWLALQFAAIFLDDIYELKDIPVARRFITRAAFAYPTIGIIHIENGEVRLADRKSTIFNIGGPGAVLVSLENVAVFEKVNGEADIVDASQGGRDYTKMLDGFESLREVIDLRDQSYPPKDDPGQTPMDIQARTKDGIPVTIKNIRFIYYVNRPSRGKSLLQPYQFDKNAITEIVYNRTKGHWRNTIYGLVRSTLVSVISENTLGEIFATVGEPEIARQKERQEKIQDQINKNASSGNPTFQQSHGATEGRPLETAAFESANTINASKLPRFEVSRKFYDNFASSFSQKSEQSGIHLEWIDVGTWQPAPTAGKLLAQHEDAARLNAENMARNDPSVLDELCRQEQAAELLRLIRQPIYRFYQLSKEDTPRDEIVASLVEEYLGALRAARDDFQKENTPMPDAVKRGLEHIMRYQRDYLKRSGGKFINGS